MEMIDDEDDKDSSHYLVFKCISHVFSSYFLSLLVMISKALLHQMVKIQDVLLHRCKFWIVTFETGITSASTRWWWLWWWIKMIMTTMMITVMRNTSGNDFSLYQNTADEQLSSFTGSCFEAPYSLLRLTSAWPGYHDYEMMVNDDIVSCAFVYLCVFVYATVFVCLRVCFCHFHSLVSHWSKISHVTR